MPADAANVEKERLATAIRRIENNIGALANETKHLAAHYRGPAADRFSADLVARQRGLQQIQADLRRLTARVDAAARMEPQARVEPPPI